MREVIHDVKIKSKKAKVKSKKLTASSADSWAGQTHLIFRKPEGLILL